MAISQPEPRLALSMTGYGAAEGDVAGRRVRVEIRTVNHRWFNLALKVSGEFANIESNLREALRRQFERGHVNVQVRWVDERPASSGVNLERADGVVAALRELQQRYRLGGEVTVDLVARQAEVFGMHLGADGAPVEWELLAPVVEAAATDCRVARRREGAVLATELSARFAEVERASARVTSLAPGRLVRERDRLSANLRELLDGRSPDTDRVAQEIAVMAARLDITEELVRIQAHLAAARQALGLDQAVGKQLGFLVQELGREVNTLGSKANDAGIAHEVVQMKAELEKIREQLENLE